MTFSRQFSSVRLLARISAITLAIAVFVCAPMVAQTVARVGTRTITKSTLDSEVRREIDSGYYHRNVSDGERLALEQKALERLIRREIDAFGGMDAGLELPSAEARRRCDDIEKQLGKEKYAESMKANGWTKADHIREVAWTLLAQEARERFVTVPSKVSDDDVRREWEATRDRWVVPESIHLQHILIRVVPEDGEAGVDEASRRARAVISRLSREDFGVVAGEVSDDDYRVRGGDLGWIHRGRLVKPLEEAVWKAEPGAIVGPIRSEIGFHIAKVLERKPASALPYEDAAKMIRKTMESERAEAAEKKWYAKTEARHPVSVVDSRFHWSR